MSQHTLRCERKERAMEKHFGVISADGHCRLMHLPFDLWTTRLPRKLLANGPRVVEGPDGTRQWVVEGRVWSGVGWAGVGRGPVNCYTRAGLPEEPEPGVFRAANATYRCEDMDRDGVDAELVNGPYEQISAIRDPELRIACVRAVNDWARELYAESDGRFIMLLPLPCQTPEEAAAELLRVADFGLPTGVIFDWVNAPEPVLHQMWEPVWAAAAETGLPVNFHANPSGGSRQMGVGVTTAAPRNQALMRVANFPMGAMGELMSAVVFSGICDRHPGVRFVLEEAGVGWVPFLFWRFDREYDFGGPDSRVFKPDIELSEQPTAFVKRQLFFTFEVEEEGGFRRVPEIGLTNFLWASDFPGLDSPWPHSKAMGHAPAEAALGKAALDQLVFENAVRLYNIPVTQPREQPK
jgi:predicted TIM-barrel fold metal-dependent hydrolase